MEFLSWRGVDRAERFCCILDLLAAEDVESEEDLRTWLLSTANLLKLRSIKGIGPKTVDYFKTGLFPLVLEPHRSENICLNLGLSVCQSLASPYCCVVVVRLSYGTRTAGAKRNSNRTNTRARKMHDKADISGVELLVRSTCKTFRTNAWNQKVGTFDRKRKPSLILLENENDENLLFELEVAF